MIKPKSPCIKDCTRRTAICHTECQEYKDFERAQEIWRNENMEAKENNRKFDEQRRRMYDKTFKNNI